MNGKHASELFTSTFIGEYVEIICKSSPQDAGKLHVTGFLLDVDDDYYYIGTNPIEVNAVVRKDIVELMNISSEASPEIEMLENMEVPDEAN